MTIAAKLRANFGPEAACLLMQQVEEALKERSQRIYKEYGNVMLDTEGMTKVRTHR